MSESGIFKAAVKLPPGHRAAYLDQACGSDVALRSEIESLLHAHDATGGFLKNVPAGPEPTEDYQPISERPGTVIGPYKLMEQIGEGGFGLVFVAEQQHPIRRRVALKIIKPGMDTRDVIARFEAERQALALMDHANIARVFEAGTTESGRPYFVMELVKGISIVDYCDSRQLTTRDRLELFLSVCQAVQHAHSKGIIHRDLKPSNILVAPHDGVPVVKVIDFGVAKAIGQRLTDKTIYTRFTQMIGTPLYMSPEQVELNALDVDIRSDVYSLGVILYELQTGTTPFDRERLETVSFDEMRRIIKEEEPPTPSSRLSSNREAATIATARQAEPAKLAKLVRGELDWIVMKALEKDRSRRYQTANSLARDIERYLADEPVEACPPSVGYRLRKFARRNRAELAVAGLVLFFFVLFGAGVCWAVWDRSAREAAATRQQVERQAKVAGEVESILGEAGRLEREQKWPEALEAARRAMAAAAAGEADSAIAERARQRMKDLEFIGRLDRIRMTDATHHYWRTKYAGKDQDYAQAFRDYGVDIDELPAEISIHRLKSRPAAVIVLAAALDDWASIRRELSESDLDRWQRLVGVARGVDPEPVREQVRAALIQPVSNVRDDLRRLADSIDVRAQHPATLYVLASTLRRVQHADSALRIARDAHYVHPGDFWLNLEQGHLLHDRKDYEGAVRFYTAALASQPNSAVAHMVLGEVLTHQNKLDDALAYLLRASELDPKEAWSHFCLGKALHNKGIREEAVAEYRKAIELNSAFGPAYHSLGLALTELNKLEEAIACTRKSIELDPKNAVVHNDLGVELFRRGRVDEAIACVRKSIELDPSPALSHFNLAKALQAKGIQDEAIAEYRKTITLDPRNLEARNALERALLSDGRVDEAIVERKKIIELNPENADAHYHLGNALKAKGDLVGAIAAFEEAIRRQPDLAGAQFPLAVAKQWDRSASVYAAALKRFGAPQWPGPSYEVIRSDEVFTRLTAHQPEDHLARIMRARLHVFERDWKRAAAEYARVNESWASLNSANLFSDGEDLFAFACVLVLLGDRDGYERFCKNWADRVGDSPAWGYPMARAWGVGPRAGVPARQIVDLAERTIQAQRAPWTLHVSSLAHYRNRQFKLAIERALESNGGTWSGNAKALNWFVLAMAHSRLDRSADARKCLEEAQRLAGPANAGGIPGGAWPYMSPQDFAELEILRREAEELINPQSKERPNQKSG